MDKSSLPFRSVKTSGSIGLLALALVCLFSSVTAAQLLCEPTFSIPYFLVDTTPTTEVRGDSYTTIVTVGETEGPLTSNDFGSYSVATGFWSH